jgi:cyclophilin family peptidyl-prolyl cis-trans isomerase
MRLDRGRGWVLALVLLALAACGESEPAGEAGMSEAAGDAAETVTASDATGGSETMAQQYEQPPAMAIDPAKRYTATLETNKGTITAELYPQDAPQTVNNFVFLAREGFYDGTPFHRIVKGFVIQGGDPTGTGSGGPGYRFDDEPIAREYERGTLAMANAGPDTNGSQFFIVLEDLRGRLPKNYTIFGKVTGGQEAVEAIAAVPTRRGPGGEQSQPTEPVTLERVTIEES